MLEDRSCVVSRGYPRACEPDNSWGCMTCRVDNGKRPLEIEEEEEEDVGPRKLPKRSEARPIVNPTLGLCETSKAMEGESLDLTLGLRGTSGPPEAQSGNKQQAGDDSGGDPDSSTLIPGLKRDSALECLIRCSRSKYGSIAVLSKSLHSVFRSGEVYKMRRLNGLIEHWVYISCNLREWEAFDPNLRRWMRLPMMDPNDCFAFSDKESLAVGTELLVFGKEFMDNVIYKYSLLSNKWSTGMRMHTPRCLFASASLGHIAVIAGGCDSHGQVFSSAELYNSETGEWETLPSMHRPRKLCSGFFMDEKFYVIGGVGGSNSKPLKCAEEFDFATRTWREIDDLSPARGDAAAENEVRVTSEAPPLVAVVDNELYAADHANMEVRKYDKATREWLTVGRLPEHADSMNGWGLAFRACGQRLICIGGPRAYGEGFIEVNSWIPSEGPPRWNLLGRKQSASFVYNCAVMGC
ncbi:F-box/kelch-repeat protein At1g26930-like [Diospyros lotus]|uniref:F-box/kelch-repeat protein At1g26930-like n=1 Tax=Diospyros lotus TaxID=55363 RepID=UPI0022575E08|nr:F-box/kelch-repeat protein At1g26930-like [Diospyros lotus]XP_052186966.1 F-box/kelch-repeat protein At1g26930-like [Diospyros lotus]